MHTIALLIISGLAVLYSEETVLGFEIQAISYPGGLSMHVRWNPETNVLVYRKANDFKQVPLDAEAKSDEQHSIEPTSSLHYELCSIAQLLHDLPNQKELPSDGISVFDGIGYQFTITTKVGKIAKEYNNPDSHNRLMDMAFVGICHRIYDLRRMYGSLMGGGD